MIPQRHDDWQRYIDQALRTDGGHLSIGCGGYSLHFGRGSTLSGHNCDEMKQACIARALPVIDSRMVAFGDVYRLAVNGPMVAVAQPPDPQPWHAFSYAPLTAIAQAYREAGAEVFNLDEDPATTSPDTPVARTTTA